MNERPIARVRIIVPVLLILVILNLLLLARLLWPALIPEGQPFSMIAAISGVTASPTILTTPTLPTPLPPVFPSVAPDASFIEGLRQQGVIILSMRDGSYFHLFAYHPQFLPLTRLTDSAWDDITPAVSPDGTRIAYSSHKNGFWDLFMFDLRTNQTIQITNTPGYDGAPSFSPDGEWLAYETYTNNNLEIGLLSLADPSSAPIMVTNDPAADYNPTWSPQGRQLAFVSTRSGEEEIWLGKLDSVENRFTNISKNSQVRETQPAWSPDGRFLAWSSDTGGLNKLFVWDSQAPDQVLRPAGQGTEPTWDPNGRALLSRLNAPNQNGLSVYEVSNGMLDLPLTPLPGELHGMVWKNGSFIDHLVPLLANASSETALPLFQPTLTVFPISPSGRFGVVPLTDIQAPFPMLQDRVDESFVSLRQAVSAQTGWDFLGSLENAFLPLTEPSEPGMGENWLYTGRAFAVNPILTHAGWMVMVREEINSQTYWRVYLKARYQDGSQGLPMTSRPWNLDARYSGDTRIYEQGGQLSAVPDGYWIDFTELAGRYGWERLPALVEWITYYPAARFNIFVLSEGLDWYSAMAQLYPPEALTTNTALPTTTNTPGAFITQSTPSPSAKLTSTMKAKTTP